MHCISYQCDYCVYTMHVCVCVRVCVCVCVCVCVRVVGYMENSLEIQPIFI